MSKDMELNSQNKNDGVLSSRGNKDLLMSAKETKLSIIKFTR